MASYTPYAIQHINLSVPEGTLHLAEEFYGQVIGFPSDPVPSLQRNSLRWCVNPSFIIPHLSTLTLTPGSASAVGSR